MTKMLCLVGAFAGLVTVFGVSINNPVTHTGLRTDTVPEKAALHYANFCAGCHGEKMMAFVDRSWKHGRTRNDLFKAIKFGYPDGGMPNFDTTFTDAETYELADYIRSGIDAMKKYDTRGQVATENRFESKGITIKLDTIVSGLNIAWGMSFLPNGDLLYTEKDGRIFKIDKSRKVQEISGGPQVHNEGQGGLMDVALHPKFKSNNTLYLTYSAFKKENGRTYSTTAIMKAVLKGSQLTQQKIIFEALPYATTSHHYGSRLAFGPDGCLYFSVGERGYHEVNPQSLATDCGKIHRIKDDGSVPADNPFVHNDTAKKTIWSYGHRNPQGLAFNPFTGSLWEDEHGPRGGDEVNIVTKGKNYGWPVITYGINYNGVPMSNKTAAPGMEQPELYWIPSIAPSGMIFVQGNRYPAWKGSMLTASLRFGYLYRCETQGDKITGEEILLKGAGRMRDVEQAADGSVYISVEKGYIFKLVPVGI